MRIDQIPRSWLMTDERMGDDLWPAINRLRPGDGIVIRHYGLAKDDRLRLAEGIQNQLQGRGIIISIASDVALAQQLEADMVHRPDTDPSALPFSLSVHSLDEARAARRSGASLVFVSPVQATRSHVGAATLGEDARMLAREAGIPAIALGGMNAELFDASYARDFHGWAGIDAWLRT